MAPKMAKVKLSDLVPTDEELAAAKKTLEAADSKVIRSKKASMMHYLKTSPDETFSNSKGTKVDFLQKFMVHQMREQMRIRTLP